MLNDAKLFHSQRLLLIEHRGHKVSQTLTLFNNLALSVMSQFSFHPLHVSDSLYFRSRSLSKIVIHKFHSVPFLLRTEYESRHDIRHNVKHVRRKTATTRASKNTKARKHSKLSKFPFCRLPWELSHSSLNEPLEIWAHKTTEYLSRANL